MKEIIIIITKQIKKVVKIICFVKRELIKWKKKFSVRELIEINLISRKIWKYVKIKPKSFEDVLHSRIWYLEIINPKIQEYSNKFNKNLL